jgi:beta-lactamase class A
MQARKEAEQSTRHKRQRTYFLSNHAIMPIVLITVGVTLFSSGLVLIRWGTRLPAPPAEQLVRLRRSYPYFLSGQAVMPVVLITVGMTLFSSSLALIRWGPRLPAPPAEQLARLKRRRSYFRSSQAIMPFVLITVSVTLSSSSDLALARWGPRLPAPLDARKTVAINGADRWNDDGKVTAAPFDFSPPDTQPMQVSPLFENYYSRHSGTSSLGSPLTAAFPTALGWIQFFGSVALLLPAVRQPSAPRVDKTLRELIEIGVKDAGTGIIRLPLLQALLTVGSQVPVGGDGSPLTYVDLRRAAHPDLMVTAPAANRTVTPLVGSQAIFIQTGTRARRAVGHLIPQPIWDYINRADISPDGWQMDFGAPLTEALSFAITRQGSIHQLLVQAFWHDGVVLDQSNLDAGPPQIHRLDTSVAYLRTFGPPAVVLRTRQTIWALGETPLLDEPGTGQAVVHVGQDFPLTLLGEATWKKGMLWYHVQWTAPNSTGTGWVSAAAITLAPSPHGPSWASFDVLSSSLQASLASLGDTVGAVVYDVTRQGYYTYHALDQFIIASSMKVPIMLTFLDMTEQQGREPTNDEMDLLTSMIENSDNDAASALYYGEIGGAAGVARYLHKIGITGLDPDPDAWGYSLITPMAMVNLLTLLYQGQILTAHDRQIALDLMENVEGDQQMGVGDTAPEGATVAMKDGWVPGPDGLWAMNSSGIVTVGQQTYIIAVYTQDQSSLDDEQASIEDLCGTVASLLVFDHTHFRVQ